MGLGFWVWGPMGSSQNQGCIGVYRGHLGIMEKNMEATI